jgi:uncharacterized membrane protein YphA (DoxX/SURF4 family)
MDPVLIIIIRYALALLWIVSAVQKLAKFEEFRIALDDYRIVPTGAVSMIVAGSLTVLELLAGLALLFPGYAPMGAIVSAGLLLVYGAAMGVNLLRGRRHIDCGCAGPALRQSLSYSLVSRNIVLAGASLVCLASFDLRSLVWLDYLTILAATLALAVLYSAFNRLVAHGPDLARLRT